MANAFRCYYNCFFDNYKRRPCCYGKRQENINKGGVTEPAGSHTTF